MLDKVYIGLQEAELNFGQIPANISKIVLRADGEHVYTAGDDTGRVIEKDCPFASQEMADYILSSVRTVVYQPFEGADALLDPAAEIGDGITVGGKYSVLVQTDITFDRLCAAGISAPTSDDLDDEYPYLSAEKRTLDRLRDAVDKLANELRDLANRIDDRPEMDRYVITFNTRDGKVVPEREDYSEYWEEDIREAIFESWKAEY